jgi:hypothetical protein
MLKISRLFVGALVVAIPLVAGGGLVAHADGPGATIRKGIGCGLSLPQLPTVTTADTTAVATPSGAMQLTCHFQGPAIAETVVIDGLKCGFDRYVTTDSHIVYSKSGRATLTCQVKAKP